MPPYNPGCHFLPLSRGNYFGLPIPINLTTIPSTSVGARAVGSGREGLHGRPRPVPVASMLGEHVTPPAGDHEGPPNPSSSTFAPTDHLALRLVSQLRLMPIE